MSHSVALTADDEVFVWGAGGGGRLGLGHTRNVQLPTRVAALCGRGLMLPVELGCTAQGTLAGTVWVLSGR
jgi:hypothetical protein